MKTKVVVVGVLGSLITGFGLLIGADGAKEEAIRNDRTLYQGTWKVVSLLADGENLTEDDCKRITVLNEFDGRWTVKVDGVIIWQGISMIDPTKTPKTIDFTPTVGVHEGKTLRGIYEIAGDSRRLCYADLAKDRPVEFSAKAGSGHVLVTFKREKAVAARPR
jgi:uncharacterized protein (TIGR03067 family)